MEFDEMKRIWDTQNNEPLYAINEKALHNRILAKKNKGHHITNVSELFWIIGNMAAGCIVLGMNLVKESDNIFVYILSAWMIASSIYMIVSRIRRIKGNHRFDRSMRGDLDYAISVAAYQINLSNLGRFNVLPIGILSILTVWDEGKSLWWAVGLIILFFLANYAAAWEHRIYKARKIELDTLQSKLENEV